MTYFHEIVFFVMAGFLGLQTWLWFKERKDLYSRLMSKDLSDYKENGTPTAKVKVPKRNKDIIQL